MVYYNPTQVPYGTPDYIPSHGASPAAGRHTPIPSSPGSTAPMMPAQLPASPLRNEQLYNNVAEPSSPIDGTNSGSGTRSPVWSERSEPTVTSSSSRAQDSRNDNTVHPQVPKPLPTLPERPAHLNPFTRPDPSALPSGAARRLASPPPAYPFFQEKQGF